MSSNPNFIQKWLSVLPIPVFAQLILSYLLVVILTVLVMFFITLANIHAVLEVQLKENLNTDINRVFAHVNKVQMVDGNIFESLNLDPYTSLKIYDATGQVVADNVSNARKDAYLHPTEPLETLVNQPLQKIRAAVGIPAYITYYKWTNQNGQMYYFQFSATATKEFYFTSALQKQFFTAALAGIFLAIILAFVITYHILKPINQIRKTIQQVNIDQLDQRVTVPSRRDEFQALSITINEALDRLELGSRHQQQFVHDASHELRTPITIINGYTEMLLRWGKDDPETLSEGLQSIHQETIYMHNLVEHLLTLAKGPQSIDKTLFLPINVKSLLQDTYQSALYMTKTHQISLSVQDEAIINGDEALLQQLLRILLENSIKYTPFGGKIEITSYKKNDEVLISIKDTGIGISADQYRKIFRRFYRVDTSRTKETGGSGLGLAIAQQIAVAHGAHITVNSIVGQETTMTISLPLVSD